MKATFKQFQELEALNRKSVSLTKRQQGDPEQKGRGPAKRNQEPQGKTVKKGKDLKKQVYEEPEPEEFEDSEGELEEEEDELLQDGEFEGDEEDLDDNEDMEEGDIDEGEEEEIEEGEEDLDGMDVEGAQAHPYSNMELDGEEEPEYDVLDQQEGVGDGKRARKEEPDLAITYVKIQEILHVLAKFSERRNPEIPRKEYMAQLQEMLCKYFGYSTELCGLFLRIFSPHECLQAMEAFETSRPMTIRTNTLKVKRRDLAQALIQKGVQLEPLASWSKVGLKITESKIPIGATPEYLSGQYMLQAASSLIPVMALAPQPGEKILDMAAAPGGKTTYIGQLMQNKGVLVANDFKPERLKSLYFNIQRMGITNSIVTNYDGRIFPKKMKNFDRILLDAPCSGIGVISRDQSIKSQKMLIDIYKSAHLQKELIRAAIDSLKVGGFLVYSTCSISVEENEEVVDYAVRKRHVKIVETGLDVGEPGIPKYVEKQFDPRMKYCRRMYPHVHNMDGFFVAKLRKIKDGSKDEEEVEPTLPEQPKQENKKKAKGAKSEKKSEKGESKKEKKQKKVEKEEPKKQELPQQKEESEVRSVKKTKKEQKKAEIKKEIVEEAKMAQKEEKPVSKKEKKEKKAQKHSK